MHTTAFLFARKTRLVQIPTKWNRLPKYLIRISLCVLLLVFIFNFTPHLPGVPGSGHPKFSSSGLHPRGLYLPRGGSPRLNVANDQFSKSVDFLFEIVGDLQKNQSIPLPADR